MVATVGKMLSRMTTWRRTAGLITGKVAKIKIQSSIQGSSYFQLKSTSAVGRCTADGGNVLALFPDDDRGKAMLSVVSAALLSGKSLGVWRDDTVISTAGGVSYCFAQYVDLTP